MYIVIDDEDFIRDIFSDIFEMKGKTVKLFSNGESALSFILSEKGTIDAVFIDYTLPGENGVEIAKKIKEKDANIKIYLMSGWSKERFKGYEKWIDEILSKPFDVSKIMDIL